MPKYSILIASDHAGFELKKGILEWLESEAHMSSSRPLNGDPWILAFAGMTYREPPPIQDLGTHSTDSVDYPDYANLMAKELAKNPHSLGILICGTGIGISIAANRHKHIRAALCTNDFMAEQARRHNDANVLVLGSKITHLPEAIHMIRIFLNTAFEGGRHARRVKKL